MTSSCTLYQVKVIILASLVLLCLLLSPPVHAQFSPGSIGNVNGWDLIPCNADGTTPYRDPFNLAPTLLHGSIILSPATPSPYLPGCAWLNDGLLNQSWDSGQATYYVPNNTPNTNSLTADASRKLFAYFKWTIPWGMAPPFWMYGPITPATPPPPYMNLLVTTNLSASAWYSSSYLVLPWQTSAVVTASDSFNDSVAYPAPPVTGSHLLRVPVSQNGAGWATVELDGSAHVALMNAVPSLNSTSLYATYNVSGSVKVPTTSLLVTLPRQISSSPSTFGSQVFDAYADLSWKLQADDTPSVAFYEGNGTYTAIAQINYVDIFSPNVYQWIVIGTPFAQYTATTSDTNLWNNLDWILPPASKPVKYFGLDLGSDPTNFPQATTVLSAVTGSSTSDPAFPLGKATVNWHLPWESAIAGPVPGMSCQYNQQITLFGSNPKNAQDVHTGDLISRDNTVPLTRDAAWEVVYSYPIDAGATQGFVLFLDRPLPIEGDLDQESIDNQIAAIQQAYGSVLSVGKAGVLFGLEGYTQLAQIYATGPFYELNAEHLLATGYTAAELLQRAKLALAESSRLQKAADLSATLIARLTTLKATASPAEVAEIDAQLPQLQRAEKDLQVGAEHLNSYDSVAESRALKAQESVTFAEVGPGRFSTQDVALGVFEHLQAFKGQAKIGTDFPTPIGLWPGITKGIDDTITGGGMIRFNLDGVDPKAAYDPTSSVYNSYTSQELRYVQANYPGHTVFYRNGALEPAPLH